MEKCCNCGELVEFYTNYDPDESGLYEGDWIICYDCSPPALCVICGESTTGVYGMPCCSLPLCDGECYYSFLELPAHKTPIHSDDCEVGK